MLAGVNTPTPSQDVPTLSTAASAINKAATDVATNAALEQDCNQGVYEACEDLSREDEAKRAWLAKLDVPAWGKVSAAVSEEAAKAAWLARQESPAWDMASGTQDMPLYAP